MTERPAPTTASCPRVSIEETPPFDNCMHLAPSSTSSKGSWSPPMLVATGCGWRSAAWRSGTCRSDAASG
eukprot:8011271-Pyramimonas_sp.AAC.1